MNKKLTFTVVLLNSLSFLNAWLPSAASEESAALVRQARLQIARGDTTSAIGTLNGALRKDATDLEARRCYANALLRAGMAQAAIDQYSQLLRFNPSVGEDLVGMANANLSLGHEKEAIDLCKRALQVDSRFTPARLSLARAYVASGQLAGAQATCQEGLALARTPAERDQLTTFITRVTERMDAAKRTVERRAQDIGS